MLQTETKKAIRIISEKYFHHVYFEHDVLKIFDDKNTISINHLKKSEFEIKYNCENFEDTILTEETEIYDVLINIFRRNGIEQVSKSRLDLITIETLLDVGEIHSNEEVKMFFDCYKCIDDEYRNIGGNRILREYYRGYLILIDDFKFNYKSNVIKIK